VRVLTLGVLERKNYRSEWSNLGKTEMVEEEEICEKRKQN